MKTSHLFFLYLKKIRRVLIFLLIIVFSFTMVFFFSHLPLSGIFYAAILSIYFGGILFIVDFSKFVKRYRSLEQLQKIVTVQLDELPSPNDAIEQQYQKLLVLLNGNKNELITRADHRQKDLVDYFTRWAHQIKTPIAAMRLVLQAEQNEQNKELEMELFKIEQYVEAALQYLRLEHISSDLHFKTYDLDTIIKQAVRKYAKIFIRKKIPLHYEEVNYNVLTDEKWLLFVIEQILSNALKYTKEGSISIYMENHQLVIEDTGVGIPSEDLPRLFEKGFTGYNGRMYKESTGMGLYLVKQIIMKLSHPIAIESEVGKGTKVIIDLKTEAIQIE